VQLTAAAGAVMSYRAEGCLALEQRVRIAASATVAASCCAAWDYGGQEMDLMWSLASKRDALTPV
jgi:hypothetical protein